MLKIGLYGGTFSPPHNGHVHALKRFLEAERPDRMLVMPAFVPPHKVREDDTDATTRLEMAKLAFAVHPCVEISDLEIRRGGKSYTVDTLRAIAQDGARIAMLCGTDMFLSLPTWYCPEEIFRLADIVYMVRETDARLHRQLPAVAKQYQETYHACVRFLPGDALELSSSEIRRDIKAHGVNAVADRLPPTVLDYIRERGLYSV